MASAHSSRCVTQNGEAKAVLQDVASYEETQETLALLKILALGNQDREAGRVKPVAANHVLDRLLQVVETLAHFPERGTYPKELVALGIKEFRQTPFKPYRVIYRVIDAQVVIYLIVDGRREMQSVLARRLFGA